MTDWIRVRETIQFCPFCAWSIFYDYSCDRHDSEQIIQERLDEHVVEMMDEVKG